MPPATSPGLHDPRRRAAGVRFRRALTLLVMTLLVPGSAQLVAGRRSVGRFAVRTWLTLLVAAVVLVVAALVWHGLAFWLAANTTVLAAVRVVLLVAAAGWALLFVDAWRLGRPLRLAQRHRLLVVGFNAMLCFAVAGTLVFASHIVAVQRDLIVTVFGDGVASSTHQGRYNVLLIGGDSGGSRWGARADSINVASIDAETGKTVLFGLPRNMTNFRFAPGSPMDRRFPNGYNCDACELNSLTTWTKNHPKALQGYPHPGVEATIEAVEGITGLPINYHVTVNLKGFRQLVNAVGGITVNVRDQIPVGGVGGPITGHIQPGVRHLNGHQALWFARSRASSDDYSRMARQKCVLNAMLNQLTPSTVVTQFRQLAEASKATVRTNLPASELDTFIDLALKARTHPVTTVSFVPPLVDTSDPNMAAIHRRVQQAIAESEGDQRPSSGDARHPARTSQASDRDRTGTAQQRGFTTSRGDGDLPTTGGAIGSYADGYAANQAESLSHAC